MAVPKRRVSKSRQGERRSHHFRTPMQMQYCKQCSEPVMPHRICPNCGYYHGRVISPKDAKEE